LERDKFTQFVEWIVASVPNSWQINDNVLSEGGLRSSSDTKLLAIIRDERFVTTLKLGIHLQFNNLVGKEELFQFIMCLNFKLDKFDKKRPKYNIDRHAMIIGLFFILDDREGREVPNTRTSKLNH